METYFEVLWRNLVEVAQWNSTFYFVIDYREHHWKGITIYYATKVNMKEKTFFLIHENVFFNTIYIYRKVKNKQSS